MASFLHGFRWVVWFFAGGILLGTVAQAQDVGKLKTDVMSEIRKKIEEAAISQPEMAWTKDLGFSDNIGPDYFRQILTYKRGVKEVPTGVGRDGSISSSGMKIEMEPDAVWFYVLLSSGPVKVATNRYFELEAGGKRFYLYYYLQMPKRPEAVRILDDLMAANLPKILAKDFRIVSNEGQAGPFRPASKSRAKAPAENGREG